MKPTFFPKLISLLTLMLVGSTAVNAYDFNMNGIYYVIHGHNVTVVSSNSNWYLGGAYSGDIAIPKTVTYNGTTYNVTAIGEGAFWICPGLTSITLPNSIVTIEDCSFTSCYNLTSIDIPNSVTSIGKQAFHGCSGLTDVSLGNSVISIERMAFYECSCLTSITIPNTVISIGESAFERCIGLTSINIPNSVNSIGDYAFASCSGLTSIKVESGNPKYDSRNNCNAIIETATNTLHVGCVSTIIPNTVTCIGKYAFVDCRELVSINIPNSVVSIGDCAFATCSGLTSLVLPNSITYIGIAAFDGCGSLTSLVIPNYVTTIGDRAFNGCRGLTDVYIGSSVAHIGEKAFGNCNNLSTVTCLATTPPNIGNEEPFPSGITDQAILYVPVRSVDTYQKHNYWSTFNKIVGINIVDDFVVDGVYYHALTPEVATVIKHPEADNYYSGDIVIPDSVSCQDMQFAVVSIDAGAFEDCSELTSVVIGNVVKSIGEEAFQGCTDLTSVTIGSGVTTISAKAFNYCNSLQTVTCLAIVPPVMESSNCFSSVAYRKAVLIVPEKSVDTYKEKDWWNCFLTIQGDGSVDPSDDSDYMRCDVNGDGEVNIADVNIVIDAILSH